MKHTLRGAYAPAALILLVAVVLVGCQLLNLDPPRSEPPGVTPVPTRLQATVPVATVPPATTPAPTPISTAGETTSRSEVLVPGAQTDLERTEGLNHYAIDLEVDVQTLTYTGRETLSYTSTATATLDTLIFRLYPNAPVIYGGGALTVTQATVDGQPAKVEVDPANVTVMRLSLPRPIEPGGHRKVVLAFEGRVPSDFGPGQKGYGIFNFGEDVLTLANFYPLLAAFEDGQWQADQVYAEGDAVYADTAEYQVQLTTPVGWMVVATGVEIDRTSSSSAIRRTYASGPVREFMVALSENFRAASKQVGDTAVNTYFLDGQEERGQVALEYATAALATYNKRFGLYPYRELDVVQAPLNMAAGVEYPGLVLIASSFYTGELNTFFEFATVHEVAHQWWYNLVGNDVIQHPWEDEALAQYSSAVYQEDVKGGAGFARLLSGWQRQVDRIEEGGKDYAVGAPLSFFAGGNLYGVVVYEKGPLFFQAVRDRIGDDAFFQSLQRYYETYKYGVAPPRGFVDIAVKVSGKDLDDLYQDWIVQGEGGQ